MDVLRTASWKPTGWNRSPSVPEGRWITREAKFKAWYIYINMSAGEGLHLCTNKAETYTNRNIQHAGLNQESQHSACLRGLVAEDLGQRLAVSPRRVSQRVHSEILRAQTYQALRAMMEVARMFVNKERPMLTCAMLTIWVRI